MLRQPYVILGFFQTHLRGGCASVVLCLRIHPAAYKQVVLELNAASIGSFAFVVMKTPIITRALQEAMQEKLGRQRLVGFRLNEDKKNRCHKHIHPAQTNGLYFNLIQLNLDLDGVGTPNSHHPPRKAKKRHRSAPC